MSPRRLRSLLLLSLALAGGLALLAGSQQWLTAHLVQAGLGDLDTAIPGTSAAPAVIPLGFALLALVAVLALAGPGLRVVAGVLGIIVGACLSGHALFSLVDPVAASAATVTKATGVDGRDSVAELVASTTMTPFPVLAIAAGALGVLTGVATLVLARRLPERTTSRYDRVRLAPVGDEDATTPGTPRASAAEARDLDAPADEGEPDTIASWDSLSRGDDPTRPAR